MAVSEKTIQEIRDLGMAKALKKAHDPSSSAEFKAGVKRFYPNASFGPKTAAAAENESAPTPKSSAPAAAESSSGNSDDNAPKVKRQLPAQASPTARAAIARRTEKAASNPTGFEIVGKGIGGLFKGGKGGQKKPSAPVAKKSNGTYDTPTGFEMIGKAIGGAFKKSDNSPAANAKRLADSEARKRKNAKANGINI